LVDGRPNEEAARLDHEAAPTRGFRRNAHRRPRRRLYTPRRPEVIELLRERDMLPALYFIFSRAGCEDAVEACLGAGLRLTTHQERARIREIVAERTARSEEHTSELQSRENLVCRLLLEKKKRE